MNLQNREKGKSETEKNSDGEVAGGDKNWENCTWCGESVGLLHNSCISFKDTNYLMHKHINSVDKIKQEHFLCETRVWNTHKHTHTQTPAQPPDLGMSDLADTHSRRH